MATPAEQFNAQPIDTQMNQIRAWFQQNPNASAQAMESAMASNGVDPQKVAMAMGNTRLPDAPASIRVAQYQNITGNRSDINDINRALVARDLGVSAEELSSLDGMPLAQSQALMGRAAEEHAVPGQVTTDQIRAYLAGNPNVSDQQIYQLMNRYGVTPLQLSQATGVDVNKILQRHQAAAQAAAQATAETIPTGLVGFEQATQSGLADVTGTLRGAQTEARAALDPAMEEVARLYNLNVGDLQQAGTQARGDIERTYGTAGQMIQPYQQAGTTALQQELALSGALGQDAFNQAYQESPYVKFLREQGERSTLAGAAATGGLGGGRVQQELVRFGQGLAGQGLQQQIQNLRSLSGQGLQAAGAGADIQTGMGTNLANLGTGIARDVAGQRQGLAGERSQYGVNVANLATSTGTNIANAQGTAAQNIASQRALAGQQLANQIAGVSSGLQNYALNQSLAQSNLLNQYGGTALSMQQGYTADQIAAMQNAANQASQSQQNYSGQQANLLSGQPFTQTQPFSYGQAFGNALNAASIGYDLAGSGQQNPAGNNQAYVGPMSGQYPSFPTQQPLGTMSGPGYQPFNVFNTNLIASRLGGVG